MAFNPNPTEGSGLPPVPEKLVSKIRKGEFVELHELLSECLAESTDSARPLPRSKAKEGLNDLNVWLQCFALYVGVLAPSKPALPHLMAYMISIIRASQEFEGSAWTTMLIGVRQPQQATNGNGRKSTLHYTPYVSPEGLSALGDVSAASAWPTKLKTAPSQTRRTPT